MNLKTEERAKAFNENKEAAETTLKRWQRQWDDLRSKAAWNKVLIPRVRPWLECEHKTTSYYSTKFLAENGCPYCGRKYTAEHVVFECEKWEEKMRVLHSKIGKKLNAQNIIEEMMENK